MRTGRLDAAEVKRSANGRWRWILTRLTSIDERDLTARHGPCPHCGGRDRYRWDDRKGDGDYVCNQCGAGDGLRLLGLLTGWQFPNVLQRVGEELGLTPRTGAPHARVELPPKDPPLPPRSTGTAILPAPADAPAAGFRHYRLGMPSATWTYRDAQGRVLMHTARFETEEGKDVLPRTWCVERTDRNGHKIGDGWAWRAPHDARPLYGLDRLAAQPEAPVLVVEGEKAADAAQRLLPRAAVVTWQGGSKAIARTDWSALEGRSVYLWPDADAAGVRAVLGWEPEGKGGRQVGIAELLVRAGAMSVSAIQPPPDVAEGWDLADAEAEGWDEERVVAHWRASRRAPAELEVPGSPDPPEPSAGDDAASPRGGGAGEPPAPPKSHYDFDRVWRLVVPIGYRGLKSYYIPRNRGELVELSPAQHDATTLCAIADIWEWQRVAMHNGKVSWTAIANAMQKGATEAGRFNQRRVRGRGCWREGEAVVVHLGEKLLVDGKPMDPLERLGRWVYLPQDELPGLSREALSKADAATVVNVAQLMRWESRSSADLLLGWLVLAPICGALSWRPHVWLLGAKGSGKTAIINLIGRLLGDFSFVGQGGVTEASVRQELGSDALPVVLDECERKNRREADRIEGLLLLARQACSGDRPIVKGGRDGKPAHFWVRSCFCFGSITLGATDPADRSRITPLALRSGPDSEQMGEADRARLQEASERWENAAALITPELGRRLVTHSIRHLPLILRNALVFKRVAAAELGGARVGDQYGHLLAGRYALDYHDEVTEERALKYVRAIDWESYAEESRAKDEVDCLATILEAPVRLTRGVHHAMEVNAGELVRLAARAFTKDEDRLMRTSGKLLNEEAELEITPDVADEELRRCGLRVRRTERDLVIASRSRWLLHLFAATAWPNHAGVLRRLPGATATDLPVRFGHGVPRQRATSVPLDLALDT